MLTPELARDLLRRGEGQTVEFKTRLRDGSTLARLIAAFANAEGGTILVGVGDRGEMVGADVEEVSRIFHAALSILRSPPKVDLEAVSLDGKQIPIITVAKGDRLALAEGGAFTRVSDRVDVMSARAISEVLKTRST